MSAPLSSLKAERVDSALMSARRPSLRPIRSSLVVVIFGIVGMSLMLAQASLVATAGYQVKRLEEINAAWERQNQDLAAEVGYLKSMDRIEQEARGRLDMVTPTSYLYVTVDALPSETSPLLEDSSGAVGGPPAITPRPWWESILLALFQMRREP